MPRKKLTKQEQPKTFIDHKKGEIYTPEQRMEAIELLYSYVNEVDTLPNLWEIAYRIGVPSNSISNWPESVGVLKRLHDKQANYIMTKLDTDTQPVRYIYLAKALLKLYDTPQPLDTTGNSMTVTLTGGPADKLVDTMSKFTQRNKQVNQGT